MLGDHLSKQNINVIYADGDVDCLIVKTAIELANTDKVVVIGEDTDLLVLLCHRFSQNLMDIRFISGKQTSTKKGHRHWDIRKTTQLLGEELCYSLPFLHALTGSDTTSRIYGISKGKVIKLFQSNSRFRRLSKCFLNASDMDERSNYDETLMACLYDATFQCLRFDSKARKVSAETLTKLKYW